MNDDFKGALAQREAAARDMQTAAQLLTSACREYSAAMDSIHALIPTITAAAGERVHNEAKSRFSDPPYDDREANQRKTSAVAARNGAAGALEAKIALALAQGFQQGTAAVTLGHELSPEAAEFLSHAIHFARARPQFSQPLGQLVGIVRAQNARLFELAK